MNSRPGQAVIVGTTPILGCHYALVSVVMGRESYTDLQGFGPPRLRTHSDRMQPGFLPGTALQPRHQQDSRAHNEVSGVSLETGVCRELSGPVLSTSDKRALSWTLSVASETACRPHVLPVASDCGADEQERWCRDLWSGCFWPSWSSCMEQHLDRKELGWTHSCACLGPGACSSQLSFLSACL